MVVVFSPRAAIRTVLAITQEIVFVVITIVELSLSLDLLNNRSGVSIVRGLDILPRTASSAVLGDKHRWSAIVVVKRVILRELVVNHKLLRLRLVYQTVVTHRWIVQSAIN